MHKIFTVCFLLFLLSGPARAGEGMWIPLLLGELNLVEMQEKGFELTAEDVYSVNAASMKDAVVVFGGGCTGSLISEEGLLITNHHCGYSAIQRHSSVEHDYLTNGFWAMSREEELPNEGLKATFLRSMEEVTASVLKGVTSEMTEEQRREVIAANSVALMEEAVAGTHFTARVESFFAGNQYFLFVNEVFDDVRLVGAPPSAIGKFGGDTDNWMWPRHTGDFSVFRVYSDENNKPANYSDTNKPYKPKYVVPVSLNGVKEGDFSMTVGYPGSTQRYMSSWGIQQRVESENKPRVEVRGVKQDIWWEAMTQNDTIRIKYANKYAGSSNYWKNSMGMNEAIANLGVIEKKKLLENRLQEWINSNPVNKEKYGNTLDILNEAYSNSGDLAKYTTYYLETFNNGIELIRFANTILQFDAEGTEQDKQDFINERLVESYKNYEPKLDRKVLPALMKLYADRVPKEYQPDIYQKIDSLFEGDYERYADWLFDNTQFTSLEELLVLLQTADTQVLSKDPAMELALSAADMGYELSSKMISFYENVLRGEREFMAALIEMDSDKAFYPDANFTQRLSYGSVAGYQPRDAVWYNYYSTTQGILEKQKPGDPEFNVQDYILKAILSGDFGRYSDENGELRVNFLSTNDITGGNSEERRVGKE